MNKLYLLPQRPKFRIREEWVMGLLVLAVVAQIGLAFAECAGIMSASTAAVSTSVVSPLQGEVLAKQAHAPEPAKVEDAAAFPSLPARG